MHVEGCKIALEGAKRVDPDELSEKMRGHLERISYVKRRAILGELENISLEDEFEGVSWSRHRRLC